jgi:hypothetical protein
MMGVREAEFMKMVHHLCGHWKDELGYLEQGLASLEQKRADLKSGNFERKAPLYRVAENANNDKLFKITHQPVTSAPVNKSINISVNVSSSAGVKWVHLHYRNVNQEQDYQTLTMLETGEKGLYQTVVPVEQVNTKWDFMYFIEIMDNNGKGIIYPDLNKETPYIIVKLIR